MTIDAEKYFRIKQILKFVLPVLIIICAISYFQREKLPDRDDILPVLYYEPLQTKTDSPPFEIEKNGIVYNIDPLYTYELYGLIVSYHHSTAWWDIYHRMWKDHINIKDICVVWGENIATGVYKLMNYNNTSFTCHVRPKRGTYSQSCPKFNNYCLSNNHLLSNNEDTGRMIMSAKTGDQIYLKGLLVNYTHNRSDSFKRKTSTTRTDYGCENIYLTEFLVLKSANTFWRTLYTLTKYLIIFSIVLFIIAHIKAPIFRRSAC